MNQLKSNLKSNDYDDEMSDKFRCSFVIHRLSIDGIWAFHDFLQNDASTDGKFTKYQPNTCIDKVSWNRKPWLDDTSQPYSNDINIKDIDFQKRLWVSAFRHCPSDFNFDCQFKLLN